MTPIDSLVEDLAARLEAAFPERVGWRTVGREAEYPVVHPDGRAADAQGLLARVADATGGAVSREGELIVGIATPDWRLLLEVGRGTVEIATRPCDDLLALSRVHADACARLVRAADAEGLRVLGYGIQPGTPAGPELMAPKQRYGVMLARMGAPWLGFATTASDQVHVAIARDEVASRTSLVNLLAPVTIALCANSPVFGGADGGVACGREIALAGVRADRNGHGMRTVPVPDVAAWVRHVVDQETWAVPGADRALPHTGDFRARAAAVGDPEAVWAAFQHHERYVWNSGRPRGAIGTIEVRAACQQPAEGCDAAAALGVGTVLAADAIGRWLSDRLGDPWPAMVAWHGAAVRHGIAAPEPFPGLLAGVLDRAADALATRGRGEERLLDPLRARLDARRGPADRAREAFRRGGLPALVDAVALEAPC